MTDLPDPTRLYLSVITKPSSATVRGLAKVHFNLMHAKAAIAVRVSRHGVDAGQIYHLVDGQWVLLYDIEQGTPVNKLPWNIK